MSTLVSHPDNVRVGQVWQDNDSRMRNRRLVVTHVRVKYILMRPEAGGKSRSYLRRRMRANSRGFRLVKEAS